MTNPITPGHQPESSQHQTTHHDAGPAEHFGDVKVATGSQAAYVTLELILWALVSTGIFITAAVVDGDGGSEGFGASEAWFYVTLLTVGLLVSRGLAKLGSRGHDGTRTL